MTVDGSALQPARDANKYSRGKLVVVAGSARYPGAAILAARASQRMGAGYTEVVTEESVVGLVRSSSPSLVVLPLEDWSPRDIPVFREEKPCAVCVGPGFIGDDASADLVARVLKRTCCPVLVDGGGLAGLSSKKTLKRLARRFEEGYPTVVTPHAGEAARLAGPLGLSADDPAQLSFDLSRALHSIVVLKGPDTFISDGTCVWLMDEGTPALAKAGTGDVLAGMTAALLAQGIEPTDAAVAGCQLHARCGKAASERLTDVSVVAEDVIESIPDVLKKMERELDVRSLIVEETLAWPIR